MKQIALIAVLGFALLCPPLHAAEGGSIASKLEMLGEMTYLKVTDLRAAKRDGLLRIQVTINNESGGNEQLYYRFRWLDEDGFTVWEEEPWKPETIYGKQSKVISVVSPSFKATDFRLELQSPNNGYSSKPPPGSIAEPSVANP